MAGSFEKPDGSVIPKKFRSSDLPSVAFEKSKDSNGESKEFKWSNGSPLASRDSFPLESRRKRSRRLVSLSSFQPSAKRQRNNSNATRRSPNKLVARVRKPESDSGSISALHDLSNLNDYLDRSGGGSDSLPQDKKDQQDQNVGKLEGLKGLSANIVIPKRPRGTLQRKKSEGHIGLKREAHDPTYDLTEPISKLSDDIILQAHLSDGKRKKRSKELRASDSTKDSPVPCREGEKCRSELTSRRKAQSRKAKGSAGEKRTPVGVEKFLVVSDEKFCGEPEDGDEAENLEQNAARMLSSRFDPMCTTSLGRTVSSLESTNESSSSHSFRVKMNNPHSKTCSVDAAGRVLRPRRRNGKGLFRKRRHFYEVCSRDMDPYAILQQRIRVFWPLDRSWYFGLVKDYDPATKMHYIQYDDRDEEWLNLQNERFKLLLFPSEITSKVSSENGDKNTTDFKCPGGITDSEPIITWLARSVCPLRASPISISKKQRRAASMNNSSILSVREGHKSISPSIISSSQFSSCIVAEKLINEKSGGLPLMKGETFSEGKRVSFVYSRKRFHNRRESFDNTTLAQNSACQTSVGRISILASVADEEVALEELDSFFLSWELKQVMLKVMIPLESMQDLPTITFRLCNAMFFLHHGKLMPFWKIVRMEAVFVDKVMGLRFFAFEGCLRRAVGIFCFIIRIFCQRNEGSKFEKRKMPSTCIGFRFSGLHDRRREFLFVLFTSFDIDNLKWRYFEDKLGRHCVKLMELAVANFTNTNFENLLCGSNQIFRNSVLSDLVSYMVALQDRSCTETRNRVTFNEHANVNRRPAVCNFSETFETHLPYPLSFASATSFSLSEHLKLLMEKNEISCDIQKAISVSAEECQRNNKLSGYSCSPMEYTSNQASEIIPENLVSTSSQAVESAGRSAGPPNSINTEGNMTQSNVGLSDMGGNKSDETVTELQRFPCNEGSCRDSKKSVSSLQEDSSSPDNYEGGCISSLNVGSQIQQFGKVEEQSLIEVIHTNNTLCKINELHSPDKTAPQSTRHENSHTSVLPTFHRHPDLWHEDLLKCGFAFSSRKPRTQVSYSIPFGNYEVGKSHRCRRQIYKKIRSHNTMRMSSISGNRQSCYAESLICDANVLVTAADRGWRECGAQVVLNSFNRRDWTISVKISGDVKYVHKVYQLLQPGARNRYTHAMLWKGGKDWTLEFTDRSQWSLFREMHAECYNRNLRAASIKTIPTPGVRLVEDADENFIEVPFVHYSHKYIRHIGTDVDIASDPSHVVYDMDSSDEEWVADLRSLDNKEGNMPKVTDDMFETVVDTFEKFAYAQSCDEFTSEEIEEYMSDLGPLDIIKAIHEHWRKKRQKKGLPLIRQFQPALWERYRQQLKEWESSLSKMHSFSDGSQTNICIPQKPPMFAFCLRPRGLDVSNKGSKQRSYKKYMFAGHHNAFAREQDGSYACDRKSNGHFIGEEAYIVGTSNHEHSDLFHWHQSPSNFSPKDATRVGSLTVTSDGVEGSHHPMLSRSYSRKMDMLLSPADSLTMPFAHNYKAKRNGVYSADLCGRPSRKQSALDGFLRHQVDADEFRLRDASSAAQHASNMAKLKKQRAQWLLHKADLALHKAMVALMTAEAIKASEEGLIGDG